MTSKSAKIAIFLFLVGSLAVPAHACGSPPFVVTRLISKERVTDIIRYRGSLVVVRTVRRQVFARANALFELPAAPMKFYTKYTAGLSRRFGEAVIEMRCGRNWAKWRVPPEYEISEIGAWRVYRNARCTRAEIVRGKEVVYDSFALNGTPISFKQIVKRFIRL